MKQTLFNLKPLTEQEVPSDISLALRSLYTSMFFDFPGRLNKERRDGQFQYRFGVKVQPPDQKLCHSRKRK